MSYSLPLSLFMQLINVRFVFVGDWGEEGRGRGKMGWNGWESLLLLSHTLSSFSLALLFFLSFSPTPTLSFFLSVFPSRSLSLFFFLSFFLSALSLSLSLSFFRSFFIFFFLPFPYFVHSFFLSFLPSFTISPVFSLSLILYFILYLSHSPSPLSINGLKEELESNGQKLLGETDPALLKSTCLISFLAIY